MAGRENSTLSVVKLVLLVAVGLVGFALLSSAVTRTTENRSRAAEEVKIIKEWDFSKGSLLGWEGVDAGVTLADKVLNARYASNGVAFSGSPYPRIRWVQNLSLPMGQKKLKVWMKVEAIEPILIGRPVRPTESESPPKTTGTPVQANFSFLFQYRKRSGSELIWSKPVSFTGTTGAGFQLYEVAWPDSLPLQLERMRILFNSVSARGAVNVQIQKVQLVVTVPKPVPSPSVVPQNTVTKTGIVARGPAGSTPYILRVGAEIKEETFGLLQAKENSDLPLGRRPIIKEINFQAYLGRTVQVWGTIGTFGVKMRTEPGIQSTSKNIPVIYVERIADLGGLPKPEGGTPGVSGWANVENNRIDTSKLPNE